MQQIGTATGTGVMPISSTIASLSLTMASGSGSMTDSFHGITCRITPTTTTHTITTRIVSLYDNTQPVDNSVPAADPTVQAVQSQLTQLGYYNGPVDGVFGPATRDAVAKYQIAKQLSVTGSLSPDTMQSLGLPEANGQFSVNTESQ